MTARRGLFIAPFDALADPRVIGDLAARAEAAGWDGVFLWDHLQYGDRVSAIADVWTCCADRWSHRSLDLAAVERLVDAGP